GQVVQVAVERVLRGDDVTRQVERVEVERQVAALGDRERVAARLGKIGEEERHLLGGLDVELGAQEGHPALVLKVGAVLDAEQRLVGAPVAGLEIVRVVGADDRRPDGRGDAERLGHDPRLLVDPVSLDLHEVVVFAEDLLVPAGGVAGPERVAGAQESRDLGVEAPGQDEKPVGVLGQELAIDAGLVVEALQVRLRHELDEILVARAVPHEDGQVVGALVTAVLGAPLLAAPRRHVELAAEDRLDAGLLGSEVEVDRAEEVAVIGERDGGEAKLLRLVDQLVELGGAVKQAVLGVDVEMDELGVLHRGPGYSHSIVDGGFEEMSNTTRLTPFTSLMIRLLIVPSRSYGSRAQSAVIASWLVTARSAITFA